MSANKDKPPPAAGQTVDLEQLAAAMPGKRIPSAQNPAAVSPFRIGAPRPQGSNRETPAASSPWMRNQQQRMPPGATVHRAVADPQLGGGGAEVPIPAAHAPAIELLYFDVKGARRIRRTPALRVLLDRLDEAPVDAAFDALTSYADVEEQREVFHVLANAEPHTVRTAMRTFHESRRADGKVVPPIVVVEGALTVSFDLLDRLDALRGAIRSFVVPELDDELSSLLERVDRFLLHRHPAASAVVDSMQTQLLAAVRKNRPRMNTRELIAQVEQALVSMRHYEIVRVFGGEHACASLHGQRTRALPCYVPEQALSQLPLARTFSARLIVELRSRVDPRREERVAARAVAIASIDFGNDQPGTRP